MLGRHCEMVCALPVASLYVVDKGGGKGSSSTADQRRLDVHESSRRHTSSRVLYKTYGSS